MPRPAPTTADAMRRGRLALAKKSRTVHTDVSEAIEAFDIEAAELPKVIDKVAITSGGYPYTERLSRKVYEKELRLLEAHQQAMREVDAAVAECDRMHAEALARADRQPEPRRSGSWSGAI